MDLVKDAKNYFQHAQEKLRDIGHITQFASEHFRDALLSPDICGSGQKAMLEDTKRLCADMQKKGLMDGKLPDLELSDFKAGYKSNANLTNNLHSMKNTYYDTFFVSREEGKEQDGMLIAQTNNIGGKGIIYSDKNNTATIVEPRDGGYLLLDEKQKTFTIENAKGEKNVEHLNDSSKMAERKKLMDRIYDSADFDIEWKGGSNFRTRVWKK